MLLILSMNQIKSPNNLNEISCDNKMSQEVANYFSSYVSSKKIKNEQDRRALQILFKELNPVDITDAMICCNIVTMQHIINSANKIFVSNLENESYDKESYRRVKDMGNKVDSTVMRLTKLLQYRSEYVDNLQYSNKDKNKFSDNFKIN